MVWGSRLQFRRQAAGRGVRHTIMIWVAFWVYALWVAFFQERQHAISLRTGIILTFGMPACASGTSLSTLGMRPVSPTRTWTGECQPKPRLRSKNFDRRISIEEFRSENLMSPRPDCRDGRLAPAGSSSMTAGRMARRRREGSSFRTSVSVICTIIAGNLGCVLPARGGSRARACVRRGPKTILPLPVRAASLPASR